METFNNIEELKFPQENEKNSFIILDDLNEMKLTTIKYKRSLNEVVIITYPFS